jgi:DNA-binding CsgD family transcriptional regulator
MWEHLMSLVEREAQLGRFRDLLAQTLAGRGHVVVVTGPVGCGRTELLHALAHQAAAAGARFLLAGASRAQRAAPLAVIGRLLRTVNLPEDIVARAGRLLDDSAVATLLDDPDRESHPVPAHVLHGLGVVLVDLIRRTPLVLAVDDAHRVDLASAQCLLYLIRRIRSAPVLVVLSIAAGPPPSPFEVELLRQPHCSRMHLAMLSPAGVRSLLAQHLPAPFAAAMAAPCHAATGGNPLLVQALIADNRGAGGADTQLTVGPQFGQALMMYLHRHEAATALRFAQGLAVLGEPADPDLVARLLDLKPATAVRALETLTAAGVLCDNRFRHPAAPAAVLDSMVPENLARLHTRAARILDRDGAPAGAVARHLLATGDTGCTWALPTLHEAAEQALEGADVDFAISCRRLALQASATPRQEAAARVALAQAEWRVDPSLSARHLSALIEANHCGTLTGSARFAPVDALLWLGRVDEAVGELDRLCGGPVPPTVDSGDALVSTRLCLAMLYPGIGGPASPDWNGLAQAARSAPAVNPRLQAARMLAQVLRYGPDDAAIHQAEQLVSAGRLDERTVIPALTALIALIFGDRLASAVRAGDRLLAEATSRRAATWQALFAYARAEIALRRGELALADQHARAALTAVRPKGWGVLIGLPLSVLIQTATAAGRHEDVVNHLRMPVPDTLFQTPAGLLYLRARGRYRYVTGRFQPALADFHRCGELMAQWHTEFPAFLPWWSDAAQACLQLGRVHEARDLVAEQLRRLTPAHVRAHAISLRVLAAASEVRHRPGLLRQAATALQGAGDQLELAYTLADLCHAHQECGDFRQARGALRQAQELAERCGADLLGMMPLPHRERIGPLSADAGHRASLAELSDAERRVAALAARGHTNRQIAARLFVTTSTVEQHLTKVYRKLQVGRSDLPLRLAVELSEGWGDDPPSRTAS